MIDTVEEILKRKELRQLLRLEEGHLRRPATLTQRFTVLLHASWNRFNAATARQVNHCQIELYFFG
jgi:hypothetical protein